KPILAGGDEAAKAETRAVTAWVLGQMLHLLHPFMPYITEELWDQFVGGSLLMQQKWPMLSEKLVQKDAQGEINWVIKLISDIRTTRAELNVPANAQIRLLINEISLPAHARLMEHQTLIMRLARLSEIDHKPKIFKGIKGSVNKVTDDASYILP